MPAESPLRDGHAARFELIETLRFDPAEGFVRGERHLARLAGSARALGFAFDAAAAWRAMEAAVVPERIQRVRLTLAPDGTLACTAAAFAPSPGPFTLAIAATRLASSDPLLGHKTSRRGVYERARAEFAADAVDEVLLLNERDEVCEGTFTNVFLPLPAEERLATPRLSCGLLPGILRGELIAAGKAFEALLTVDDLAACDRLFVGNSLRGLVEARLAPGSVPLGR